MTNVPMKGDDARANTAATTTSPAAHATTPVSAQPVVAAQPATAPAAAHAEAVSPRDAMLGEIGSKWSKFTANELSALKTNEELVTQVVAKYGLEKGIAQRDVNTLMAGRHLKI